MNPRMNIWPCLVERLLHITALLAFLLAASCAVRVPPLPEPPVPANEAGRLPETRTAQHDELPAPAGVVALPRDDRVDLYWQEPEGWRDREDWAFEIEVDEGAGFHRVVLSDVPGFAYFFREKPPRHARVRSIAQSSGAPRQTSEWSEIVISPPPDGPRDLIAEIQEASFRYFWNYRHPVSFLPREGVGGWNRNMCSIAAAGMMFFNIATGIENGWITPEEGRAHVLTALRFLVEKAERFHGVLPHWVHGETGKVIAFSEKDDGADLVEHAFVVAGALFVREYFKDDASVEAEEIRRLAQRLWEETEWTWFVKRRPDGRAPLVWHWSPRHGFAIDLEIAGFNESAIVYLLALASPTHPISLNSYTNGWIAPGYGHRRRHYGVDLRLGREPLGPPLFFAHYSYLGVDPRVLYFDGKSYFEHFADFCRVQEAWAAEHLREYPRGIWGLTAGMGPDGYGVFYPGKSDGTITPTAALASMPYAPQSVRQFAEMLYKHYARSLWGPYGFRDGVNARRNWFSPHYIAINVGPIAPIIQNHRTGLGWRTLMRAPEIQRAIAMVNSAMSPVGPPPSTQPAMKIPARISASSEQDGLFAAYAMDGDLATRWSSDFADDQWWQADFDEPTPIAGLAIRWEQAFAERYRVEITEDGHSWRTVYEVSSSDGGRDLLFLSPREQRGFDSSARNAERDGGTPSGKSI